MKSKLFWKAFGLALAAMLLMELTVLVVGVALAYCFISDDAMTNLHIVPTVLWYAACYAVGAVLLGAYAEVRASSRHGKCGLERMIQAYRDRIIYWNILGLIFVFSTGIALLASKMCPPDDPRKQPD